MVGSSTAVLELTFHPEGVPWNRLLTWAPRSLWPAFPACLYLIEAILRDGSTAVYVANHTASVTAITGICV